MTTERTETFSDGVFAIAITLLVLEIGVPTPRGPSLATVLIAQWPGHAFYAVSFFTIGIIWLNHHAVFAALARADRTLLMLNLALLGRWRSFPGRRP